MNNTNANTARAGIPEGYSMAVIKLYLWVGLISALLLRLVIIADHYGDFYARVLWYLGVVGYLWFFGHRYHIAKRRFNVIREMDILAKVQNRECLTERDFEGLNYVLWSLSVSKERLNYLVIFVFSLIAIVVSLTLDLGIRG